MWDGNFLFYNSPNGARYSDYTLWAVGTTYLAGVGTLDLLQYISYLGYCLGTVGTILLGLGSWSHEWQSLIVGPITIGLCMWDIVSCFFLCLPEFDEVAVSWWCGHFLMKWPFLDEVAISWWSGCFLMKSMFLDDILLIVKYWCFTNKVLALIYDSSKSMIWRICPKYD